MKTEIVNIITQKGKQTAIRIGDSKFSGIDITINKKNRSFYVSAFYDGFCGIQGAEIDFDEFVSLFSKGKE